MRQNNQLLLRQYVFPLFLCFVFLTCDLSARQQADKERSPLPDAPESNKPFASGLFDSGASGSGERSLSACCLAERSHVKNTKHKNNGKTYWRRSSWLFWRIEIAYRLECTGSCSNPPSLRNC